MLRSSINELNVDGCNIPFFNMLAQHGPKHYLSGFPLQIPNSIFFESGIPRTWYSNAADGTIARKEARHFSVDDIWHAFVKQSAHPSPQRKRAESKSTERQRRHSPRNGDASHDGVANGPSSSSSPRVSSSEDDIIAVLISVPPPSYENSGQPTSTVTHHLTRAMLRQMLFHREGGGPGAELVRAHRRFLLQQFQYPQGWYNSVIRVTWAPKLAVVEALRSTCSLRDTWKQPDARGGTFENPNDAVRTSLPDSVHQAVKETCQYIAMHLTDVTGGANVAGMLLYFKINASRELLLLYPGSVRVHLPSSPQKLAGRTSPKDLDIGAAASSSSTPPPCDTLPSPLSPGHRLPSISPGRMASQSSIKMSSSMASFLHERSAGADRKAPKDLEKRPFLNIWHEVNSGVEMQRKSDLDVALSPKVRQPQPTSSNVLSSGKRLPLKHSGAVSPQQRLSPLPSRRLFEQAIKNNEQKDEQERQHQQFANAAHYERGPSALEKMLPRQHDHRNHHQSPDVGALRHPALHMMEDQTPQIISGTRPIATTEELYVAAARNLGIPIPRGLQKKFDVGPHILSPAPSSKRPYLQDMYQGPAMMLLQRRPRLQSSLDEAPSPPIRSVYERLQQSPYAPHPATGAAMGANKFSGNIEHQQSYHVGVPHDEPPALPEAQRWEQQLLQPDIATMLTPPLLPFDGHERHVSPQGPLQGGRSSPTYFRHTESVSPSLEFVLRNQQRFQKNSGLRSGVRLQPIQARYAPPHATNRSHSPQYRQNPHQTHRPHNHHHHSDIYNLKQEIPASPHRGAPAAAATLAPLPFEDTEALEQLLKRMSDEDTTGIHFPLPYMRTQSDDTLSPSGQSQKQLYTHEISSNKKGSQSQQQQQLQIKTKMGDRRQRSSTPHNPMLDSFAASLRSIESALQSPLASTVERRQALEAMEDLLYCIRGALPKTQPTKHRSLTVSPSAELNFGFDPNVLPPSLVAQAFSPLGAEVKTAGAAGAVIVSGGAHTQQHIPRTANKLTFSVPSQLSDDDGTSVAGAVLGEADSQLEDTCIVTIAPPVQQSDLLKAVHICEQNIKQYKRRGKMTFPRSGGQGASSPTASAKATSPNLEYLFDFYEHNRLSQHSNTAEAPHSTLQQQQLVKNSPSQSGALHPDHAHCAISNSPAPLHRHDEAKAYPSTPPHQHPYATTNTEDSTPPANPHDDLRAITPPQEVLETLLSTLPRTPPCTLSTE